MLRVTSISVWRARVTYFSVRCSRVCVALSVTHVSVFCVANLVLVVVLVVIMLAVLRVVVVPADTVNSVLQRWLGIA